MQVSRIKFQDVLSPYQVTIGYTPLKDEPDATVLVPKVLNFSFVVPADHKVSPIKIAEQVKQRFGDARVCVYIPGRMFDELGTRYGRGGGWYDRFLSFLPAHWLRIGFCFEAQFSTKLLERQVWDEPVDWVCVKKQDEVVCYETKVRVTQ